jgi:hypothetical protein
VPAEFNYSRFNCFFMINFVWYTAWVLFPLIPALLLFIALPRSSRAWLKGLFQGMEIKLSGSVAVYFLIFHSMDPVKLDLMDAPTFQDGWELETSFIDTANNPVSSRQLVSIEAIPLTTFEPLDDKRINVYLPVLQVRRDKTLTIPYKLRFVFDDYEAQTVSAKDYFNKEEFCAVTWEEQVISLKNFPKLVAKKKNPPDSTMQLPAHESSLN